MKRRTVGFDPKLLVQALVTIIVALAAYFGLDLEVELVAALAVVLGAVAGYLAPAPEVKGSG
jgi:hypothetical protein